MLIKTKYNFYFASKADWRYRYAGLMTLSSTAEGAHKQMEAYLDQMVDGIVGFLKDPVMNSPFSDFKLIVFGSRWKGLMGF